MSHPFAGLPALDGTLNTDEHSLAWAAHDYGGVVHHRPAAVLRAATPADISTMVRYGREHGLQVVPRGQGHSTGGQAQAPGGVVVDQRA